MLDMAHEHEELLKNLVAESDPKYQAGSQMVMKTRLRVYGVRTPNLRAITRSWSESHGSSGWSEVLGYVERLWISESQEERAVAILLLERYKRRIPQLEWDHFDRWRKLLDNWGLTDGLGTLVFSPWLAADFAGRRDHLWFLIGESDVWSRRLALVGTVHLNRTHTTFIPDVTFGLIDRVKHERDPMITKAVSWALRELIRTDKPGVARYLDDNRSTLASLVVREVTNKLRTGLKTPKGR